ncbi:MAG TPA: sialidase family protein [Usitatibacter sp.]|nr:sialidase family protein [Usitatibacter sp.]
MVPFGMRTPFRISSLAFLVASALAPAAAVADLTQLGGVLVLPVEEDVSAFDADAVGDATVKGNVRSLGGTLAARMHAAVQSGNLPASTVGSFGVSGRGNGKGPLDKLNVQANDPNLDHIQTFPPSQVVTRPFEFATQSETSAVVNGRHMVVGYNTSAGAVVEFIPGFGLAFTQLMLSGVSTSHDGGKTWSSGFVPSVSPDVPFTFGDPSLGIDRAGNVYYASLGTDTTGAHNGIILNKSSDNGTSFATAVVVAVDDGSDKEWLAVGPDPATPSRDNVYVTWTSFLASSSQLMLAKSTDGGATFTTKTLFAPVDDGINSAFIQFSNPVVDSSTGRLYIPFLHFGDTDADNIRVLVSDDGGDTFKFLAFNVPGAVDAFAFPNVQPGQLIDCAGGGLRNALIAGPDQGGGRFGLLRPKQATRLITQPQPAAVNGAFMFAVNSSTSAIFGDPAAGSEIRLAYSPDGGQSWNPTVKVAASTTADPQHVHPALSVSGDGHTVNVSYYVQQSDSRLRTDLAKLNVVSGGLVLRGASALSSTSFELTPSNVVRTPTATTNFDRTIVSCYDIGEYQSLVRPQAGPGNANGNLFAAWGDNRNTWVGPPDSAAPGPHSQADVFTASVPGN